MNTPQNAVPVLIEKPEIRTVYLEDIKDTDHIGVVMDRNRKAHIITYGKMKFCIIGMESTETVCNNMWTLYNEVKGIQNALDMADGYVQAIYKFNTRKDLYKWLAED